MAKQITGIIVGNGDRATAYCKTALEHPNMLKIVGVVDPNPIKRQNARDLYGVGENMCFSDISELLVLDKCADCIINTTMDELHISTSIPLLKKGYDMLLEKPITNNEKELLELKEVAKTNGNLLMICHVLRYTPFYRKIKEILLSGSIGEIMNIEINENVCIEHASAAYIRGKWRNSKECGSTMLLAKCCHDLDLLCWLNNNTYPKSVASFGGRNFLIKEKAPKGSGTRCLVDCPYVDSCHFSAKAIYLEHDFYGNYAWDCFEKDFREVTKEEKLRSLMTDNVHGECAYKTNADIVDHQVLILEFANGSTASHSMITAQPRPGRKIHIMGTHGEIEGYLDGNVFYERKYCKDTGGYTKQKYDFNNILDPNDKHFGGDGDLMMDFVKVLQGQQPSVSFTSIDDSINGHLCVFKAEEAREQHCVKEI